MISDPLSRMTVGSVSHINENKKDLVKDVHRFSIFATILEDSPNGGFMVHFNFELSLVVEVNSKKYLHK